MSAPPVGTYVLFVMPSGAIRPAVVVAHVADEAAPTDAVDLMVTHHPEDRTGTAFAYSFWTRPDEVDHAPGTYHLAGA